MLEHSCCKIKSLEENNQNLQAFFSFMHGKNVVNIWQDGNCLLILWWTIK